jgi:hypothetical protein
LVIFGELVEVKNLFAFFARFGDRLRNCRERGGLIGEIVEVEGWLHSGSTHQIIILIMSAAQKRAISNARLGLQ